MSAPARSPWWVALSPLAAAIVGMGCTSILGDFEIDGQLDEDSGTMDSSHADARDVAVDATDGGASDGRTEDVLDAAADAFVGCAKSVTTYEKFTSRMFGCPGSVLWKERDSLCAPGCSACTAAQWAATNGVFKPSHHYWTNDMLGWKGTASRRCGVALDGGLCQSWMLDASLPVDSPMHVCAPPEDASVESYVKDPEGNECTWWGCAYNGLTPDASDLHFGGCSNGPTAGTLCCCPEI